MLFASCLVCKKEFRTFPSYIKNGAGKFCSHRCSGKINYNCKGYKATKEYREKLSKIAKEKGFGKWIKGRKPWNYGKRYSFNPPKKCIICNKEFEFLISSKGTKLYRDTCSTKCFKKLQHTVLSNAQRGKPRPNQQGEKHRRWKNGIRRDNGYIYLYQGVNKKYIAEHRLVAEQKIGRKLTRNEVVHHKNKIRNDNRTENLEVMTSSEHGKLHKTLDKTAQ